MHDKNVLICFLEYTYIKMVLTKSHLVFILFYIFDNFETCYMKTDPFIVIIGAGAAGIASATKLLENNFTNIVILEAENYIGGRIHSVKFGDAMIDLGAEFCHGEEGNIVNSMVKDLDVLRHRTAPAKIIESNGNILPSDRILNFAHGLKNEDDLCSHLTSVGDCLDARFQSETYNWLSAYTKRWITNYVSLYDTPLDLHNLSRHSEYKKCNGDIWQNWNGHGYKTILDVMIKKFPNSENQSPIDNKIFLNTKVVSIQNWKTEDQIKILTNDGKIVMADYVIFTPSLGVLKPDHNQLFKPNLPEEKITAIEKRGFGTAIKIALLFVKEIPTEEYLGVIWSERDIEEMKMKNLTWLQSFLGIVRANNNPKVLIGWYAGPNVTNIENISDEEIYQGQIFIVEKILKARYNISQPEKVIRSFWYTNPHFRGVISYESADSQDKETNNFQKIMSKELINEKGKPNIFFAGEATHPYYFSTVHGAIESGHREAKILLNYIRSNDRNLNL